MDVEKEADKIQTWMYSVNPKLARTRVVKAVAKHLMLSSPWFIRGHMYDVQTKPVGAGVHEVWIERREYGRPS